MFGKNKMINTLVEHFGKQPDVREVFGRKPGAARPKDRGTEMVEGC